ncbi:MAG: DUF5518 domain-containing protein [Haloarculaceae archaeon]
MGVTEARDGEGEATTGIGRPVPEFVDWVAAAVIAVGGLALTVGGSTLAFVVDRDLVAESVESGEITVVVFERDLTETEMVDFTLEVVSWTGIGLLVTGVALVVFAAGYVVARRRAHRRTAAGESAGSFRAHAVLGAVTSAVLSFVPFSPVVGSGIAGYLQHREGGRSVSVGALSGFLAVAPAIAIVVFVTVGIYAGLSAVGESGLGMVTAASMLLVLLFVAAYGAGLGAVGGFAGGRIAADRSRRAD